MLISAAVISESDDVTVWERRSTTFTCVLDGNIRSDDAVWYRFIVGTSTTEKANAQGMDMTVVLIPSQNSFTTSLTITNATKDTTGLDYHLMMSAMYLLP